MMMMMILGLFNNLLSLAFANENMCGKSVSEESSYIHL